MIQTEDPFKDTSWAYEGHEGQGEWWIKLLGGVFSPIDSREVRHTGVFIFLIGKMGFLNSWSRQSLLKYTKMLSLLP